MKRLTVFSAPKPFTDAHIDVIQRNAIRSWQQMGEEIEILLIGDEPGLADAAAELEVKHLPGVKRNEHGTPLVSSIFEMAREASTAELLMFTNTDMMYLPQTLSTSLKVKGQAPEFVLLGQRYDLDLREPYDFSAGWQDRLQQEAHARGSLHPHGGSDYFIFPRGLFADIPDFAIGRAGWDNWMIHYAVSQPWPAVDATQSLLAVHQTHDYGHLDSERGHQRHPETTANTELAGGMRKMYMLLDVEHELIGGCIKPAKPSLLRWLRGIERRLQPDEPVARGWRRPALRAVRKLRRALARAEAN
jgi:hypothetical protein